MTQTVFLTGALNRYGRAIAGRFKAKGYTVVLLDRDEAALQELAEELDVAYAAGDLQQEDGAAQTVTAALAASGTVDVLVNNTADFPSGGFEETAPDSLRQAFASCIIPVLNVSNAVVKILKEQNKGGHIVNMSRDNAFTTDPQEFLSSTVSWALRGTTRAMASQLAGQDIKVNACCVGPQASDEEAANVAFYLGSDVNQNITGQNVMVNHGRYTD